MLERSACWKKCWRTFCLVKGMLECWRCWRRGSPPPPKLPSNLYPYTTLNRTYVRIRVICTCRHGGWTEGEGGSFQHSNISNMGLTCENNLQHAFPTQGSFQHFRSNRHRTATQSDPTNVES